MLVGRERKCFAGWEQRSFLAHRIGPLRTGILIGLFISVT